MAMALRWDPILDPKLKATRRPGRPKTQWTDDICNHIGSEHDYDTNDAMRNTDDDVTTTTTPANNEKWLQMESQQHAGLEDSFAKALRTTAWATAAISASSHRDATTTINSSTA